MKRLYQKLDKLKKKESKILAKIYNLLEKQIKEKRANEMKR